MSVLITRPRAEAEALAKALEERGHQTLIEPLLTIEPIPGAGADLAGVQAIVLTSAHAVPGLAGTDPGRPVFVVGEATARAARAAGCADVRAAGGDAARLARLIIRECRPDGGALLHLAGAVVRPGLAETLGAVGFDVRRRAVYRAVASTSLSQPVAEEFRRRAIAAVLLFSPRSAAILIDLLARHDLTECLGETRAICLSAAVAAACRRLRWAEVRSAAHPRVEMLLRQLEGPGGRC